MKFLKGSLIVITLIVIASVTWYGSYKNDMKELEDGLRTYLTVEKGMDENNIINITARRSKMPQYPVGVQLKDNPQEYVYTYIGEQWVQLNDVTIGFFADKNGTIINVDAFMGKTTRILGNQIN